MTTYKKPPGIQIHLIYFLIKYVALPGNQNQSCIVGAFIHIYNPYARTSKSRTTTYRPYKYLFHAGIEQATRSAAVHCSILCQICRLKDIETNNRQTHLFGAPWAISLDTTNAGQHIRLNLSTVKLHFLSDVITFTNT